MDKLEYMFQKNQELTKTIVGKVDSLRPEQSAMALLVEAAELLNSTAWKWWTYKETNREEMAEEAIDVMFFLLQFFDLIGMTSEDIVHEFDRKFEINKRRIQNSKVSETHAH
jgi:dimeric dUTPase (all-alpha-NTP-PPase superfamily)